MEEKLIEFVKAHPFIYDRHDRNNKNISLRNKKFAELSKQLNIPPNKLRERWRTLRDQFYKELRNANRGHARKREWKWMEHLQFLANTDVSSTEKLEQPASEETVFSEVFADIGKTELLDVQTNGVERNRDGKSASQLFFDCLARQTEDANLTPQTFAQLQMEILKAFNNVVFGYS